MSSSSTLDSLSTPLIAEAFLSPPPPSHAKYTTARHCHLWDVPTPVRSLMLDYMDDRTAIRYLSTCQSLHAGYHHYPLKRPMAESVFREVTQLDKYLAPPRARAMSLLFALVLVFVVILLVVPIIRLWAWPHSLFSSIGVTAICMICWGCCGGWLMATRRGECCMRGRRRYVEAAVPDAEGDQTE